MENPVHPLRAAPADLDRAVRHGPAHLRPIVLAVRDHGCEYVFIPQEAGPFALAKSDRPLIALIGDDLADAMGPCGFDLRSLEKLIKRASAATVISSGPEPTPYKAAATNAALLRQDVLIIETRPEREIEWIQLLLEHQPALGILVCSAREGQA